MIKVALPEKGIKTMDAIIMITAANRNILSHHPGIYMSSNEVAVSVNLSRITIKYHKN
jgi:hypothetical protein